jgi:putative flavoprotein involved in K+ transport
VERVDVLVIGGGQAGLTTGYHLQRQGADFRIVDAAPSPGHAWRSRWDSLVLFTSRRFSALPGMPVPGDPDSHPGKDAIAAYLDAYAQRFHLPLQLDTAVESLARNGSGFVAHTPRDAIAARAVIVATGPFQTPAVPAAISGPLAPSVQQVHSSAYRNPGQLAPGPTLVVGGGNSGFQIALELAQAGRYVHLAEGLRNRVLPQRLLGRDLFWWLDRLGYMRISADSRLGTRLRQRDTIIGTTWNMLAAAGIQLHPRLTGTDGDTAAFADGTTLAGIRAVVWATGFCMDHSWIAIPDALSDGALVQRHGSTPIPSLYTVGLPWQRNRGSALIGWVGADAAEIAALAARPTSAPQPAA